MARELRDGEKMAPRGKYRIARKDEDRWRVEIDLPSLDEAMQYIEDYPQWGWRVYDDKGNLKDDTPKKKSVGSEAH